MGSNMFSLEPDLATGNMVQSQISMSAWALLPPGEKHFISQPWAKCKKKKTPRTECVAKPRGAQIQRQIINQLFKKCFLSVQGGGHGGAVVSAVTSQ